MRSTVPVGSQPCCGASRAGSPRRCRPRRSPRARRRGDRRWSRASVRAGCRAGTAPRPSRAASRLARPAASTRGAATSPPPPKTQQHRARAMRTLDPARALRVEVPHRTPPRASPAPRGRRPARSRAGSGTSIVSVPRATTSTRAACLASRPRARAAAAVSMQPALLAPRLAHVVAELHRLEAQREVRDEGRRGREHRDRPEHEQARAEARARRRRCSADAEPPRRCRHAAARLAALTTLLRVGSARAARPRSFALRARGFVRVSSSAATTGFFVRGSKPRVAAERALDAPVLERVERDDATTPSSARTSGSVTRASARARRARR